MIDLLIVGAGPAGLSAALEAARRGVVPIVVDNRPEPGGNVYAFLNGNRTRRPERMDIFGSDYAKGGALLDRFQEAAGAGRIRYRPSTQLWWLRRDGEYAYNGPQGCEAGCARKVILATGAQERPMPLVGWTLPGVMGVGAAQILMKSGGALPDGDIVLVGAGPLPLLLTDQLARAGRPVAAVVEPEGASELLAAAHLAVFALAAPKTALKGLVLLGKRAMRRTPVWRAARDLEILGTDCVTGLRFRAGKTVEVQASTVLIHDGIIPNLNPMRAAGLKMAYSERQKTWHPQGDDVILLAGDGAGVLGADGAVVTGRLAARKALGVRPSWRDLVALRRLRAFRTFLESAYPPVRTALDAAPETVLCRCEAIRAERVAAAIRTHGADPNAIKRSLRIGMGACQGRMCGHTLVDFTSARSNLSPASIGLPRARNPILPVDFKTVAGLE